jgi:hypothetical protein
MTQKLLLPVDHNLCGPFLLSSTPVNAFVFRRSVLSDLVIGVFASGNVSQVAFPVIQKVSIFVVGLYTFWGFIDKPVHQSRTCFASPLVACGITIAAEMPFPLRQIVKVLSVDNCLGTICEVYQKRFHLPHPCHKRWVTVVLGAIQHQVRMAAIAAARVAAHVVPVLAQARAVARLADGVARVGGLGAHCCTFFAGLRFSMPIRIWLIWLSSLARVGVNPALSRALASASFQRGTSGLGASILDPHRMPVQHHQRLGVAVGAISFIRPAVILPIVARDDETLAAAGLADSGHYADSFRNSASWARRIASRIDWLSEECRQRWRSASSSELLSSSKLIVRLKNSLGINNFHLLIGFQ